MTDDKYSGHTAEEVIELMGMLAAQHDVHSADEALAIARRGYALLKDLQSRLDRWEQVWTTLNDMGAALGDANKPLAVAASWTLMQRWVNDLQSGMYINCVYCGHRYGPNSEVPAAMADVLKEHIEQCPRHPLSQERAARIAADGRLGAYRERTIVQGVHGARCSVCDGTWAYTRGAEMHEEWCPNQPIAVERQLEK